MQYSLAHKRETFVQVQATGRPLPLSPCAITFDFTFSTLTIFSIDRPVRFSQRFSPKLLSDPAHCERADARIWAVLASNVKWLNSKEQSLLLFCINGLMIATISFYSMPYVIFPSIKRYLHDHSQLRRGRMPSHSWFCPLDFLFNTSNVLQSLAE